MQNKCQLCKRWLVTINANPTHEQILGIILPIADVHNGVLHALVITYAKLLCFIQRVSHMHWSCVNYLTSVRDQCMWDTRIKYNNFAKL